MEWGLKLDGRHYHHQRVAQRLIPQYEEKCDEDGKVISRILTSLDFEYEWDDQEFTQDRDSFKMVDPYTFKAMQIALMKFNNPPEAEGGTDLKGGEDMEALQLQLERGSEA